MRAVCLVALLPTRRQAGRCLVLRGGVLMAIRKIFTDAAGETTALELAINLSAKAIGVYAYKTDDAEYCVEVILMASEAAALARDLLAMVEEMRKSEADDGPR